MTSHLFKHSTFEVFLETVRVRPGMYFGKAPLTGLWCMLTGYEMAVEEHKIPKSERLDCCLVEEFDNWLRQQFGMGNAIGWYLFIINETKSEKEAWNRFLELWDKFLSCKLDSKRF
ncbi:hypothetical protein H6F74_25005 [Trichocoleus sp. FACHB-90]|uniref:hypothetical protein n=1 Tax=Cyanophyceae TaxID=3028117 RepID=UPI0016867163|nr:hypothetical protein [Trichocoleus sp. FACHB-90]MBD1929475.1 hypothetical protein [Trichocoleus sp. FACHB-90]